ncbi:TetR/AcrR family transcriptional regulator [Methylobacterium sp. NPDC080182]|uniref:TetR/AcrR family transcriptional regulator n=1 Tax=Methylobacterium sp. NPDC080182 TaxID=3390590 RepID=UPI003CFE5324
MNAFAQTAIKAPDVLSVRQEQILDAAEACFVRNGFHRSSMQDLAREARMSAPNIYRYFDSKEAVLLGMAERERRRGRERIEGFERVGDKRAALMSVIEHYHLTIPREAAILRVELWSEATRNPPIAAILQERETLGRAWMVGILSAIATSPNCDAEGLCDAIAAQLKGVVVSRAFLPDYDPTPAVAQLHALIEAGLAGRIAEAP